MTKDFVIFDFDHTLIKQSSLKLLLIELYGKPVVIWAAIQAVAAALPPHSVPRREIFRANLLKKLLAGREVAEITAAANQIAPFLKWNEDLRARYAWHKAEGHRILIATGGLAAYMPVLLAAGGIRYDGLLASEMVTDGETFTGEMLGPACTWDEKARRVKNWVAEQGLSFTDNESWGYGNPPNDNAMLALTRHPSKIAP